MNQLFLPILSQNNMLEQNMQVLEQQQNNSKYQELYCYNVHYKSICDRLNVLFNEREELQNKTADLLKQCYNCYCNNTDDKLITYQKYIESICKLLDLVLESLSLGNAFMRFERREKLYESIKKKYSDLCITRLIDILVNKPIEEPKNSTTLQQLRDYLILQISPRSRNYYYRTFYRLKKEFEEI